MIKRHSFIAQAMRENNEEFLELQSYFDSRYVKKAHCADNTKVIRENINSLHDNISDITSKLNMLVWILSIMGVATICIAFKILFGGS